MIRPVLRLCPPEGLPAIPMAYKVVLPVAPPFRTTPRLNIQQVATRSKGAPVSIGNSPEDDRPSIGRALQQARIDAGLTVDEVSTSTRVRVPIVQAIEEDDFSRCGGDVYARGHIRTLARAVGLDPDPLIEAVRRRARRPPRADARGAAVRGRADPLRTPSAQLDRGHGRRDRRRGRLRRLHALQRRGRGLGLGTGRGRLDSRQDHSQAHHDQARRPQARPLRQRHRRGSARTR